MRNVEKSLRYQLQTLLCDEARKAIDEEAATGLATLNTHVQVSSQLVLDYGLVASPVSLRDTSRRFIAASSSTPGIHRRRRLDHRRCWIRIRRRGWWLSGFPITFWIRLGMRCTKTVASIASSPRRTCHRLLQSYSIWPVVQTASASAGCCHRHQSCIQRHRWNSICNPRRRRLRQLEGKVSRLHWLEQRYWTRGLRTAKKAYLLKLKVS